MPKPLSLLQRRLKLKDALQKHCAGEHGDRRTAVLQRCDQLFIAWSTLASRGTAAGDALEAAWKELVTFCQDVQFVELHRHCKARQPVGGEHHDGRKSRNEYRAKLSKEQDAKVLADIGVDKSRFSGMKKVEYFRWAFHRLVRTVAGYCLADYVRFCYNGGQPRQGRTNKRVSDDGKRSRKRKSPRPLQNAVISTKRAAVAAVVTPAWVVPDLIGPDESNGFGSGSPPSSPSCSSSSGDDALLESEQCDTSRDLMEEWISGDLKLDL